MISPDHRVFGHTNPLRGPGRRRHVHPAVAASRRSRSGRNCPSRRDARSATKKIKFFILDGFAVAKRHAPTPELETRMMGIAFIGAVCGHVERIKAGASEDVLLDKIRSQIGKKFGAKGGAVVEGNIAVMREGLERDAPRRLRPTRSSCRRRPAAGKSRRSVAISAGMCRVGRRRRRTADSSTATTTSDMVAAPFREGTIAEAPVLPGTGLFMPAGTAAWKDKGLFRRDVPQFLAEHCTGCMECALVCPDAAIPNTVHDIHDLLQTGIRQLDLPEPQRAELLAQVVPVRPRPCAPATRRRKEAIAFHDVVADAATGLDGANANVRRNVAQARRGAGEVPGGAHPAVLRRRRKGSAPAAAGCISAAIDPWKCSGCLECIEVCGPGALLPRDAGRSLARRTAGTLRVPEQNREHARPLRRRAAVPGRRHQAHDARPRELLRDHRRPRRLPRLRRSHGHPARDVDEPCDPAAGAQEHVARPRTADRGAHGQARVSARRRGASRAHRRRPSRRSRGASTCSRAGRPATGRPRHGDCQRDRLQQRLCLDVPVQSVQRPVGQQPVPGHPGRSPRGCSRASPRTRVDDIKALRVARLELEDAYEPAVHDRYFRMLAWDEFTPQELALLPTAFSIGGDGATYDIGFGALSRLLTTARRSR